MGWLDSFSGWLFTSKKERERTEKIAAEQAAILERQRADGLLSEDEFQRQMASITDTADLSATVGEAVNDRIPSALAESASELPGRINTAIDTVGKGFWNSIPGWLKFLGFAALGIWVLTLLKPYIDGALKAKGVLKK